MKKINLVNTALCLLVLGAASLLGFNLIGSSLDAQGFLHEPFALLPVGWFLIALGMLLLIAFLRGWLAKSK